MQPKNLAIAVALLSLMASMGCELKSAPKSNSTQSSSAEKSQTTESQAKHNGVDGLVEKTVQLVVDYGDGVQKRYADLAWREKMTAFDSLQSAKIHSHGVSFESHGDGETLLITKIDDVSNQGGGGNDKNWTFLVNDHLADKSCGVFAVKPGDVILWKFDLYK